MHIARRENRMQMTSLWIRLALTVLPILIAQPSLEAHSTKAIPVEVWPGGDDGLTLRLRASIEEEFKSSSAFALSSGKKPGTLIVTIPAHVGWKRVGKRMKVLYSIQFASINGKPLGRSKGSCWDDVLTKCSEKVVSDAVAAARKLRRE